MRLSSVANVRLASGDATVKVYYSPDEVWVWPQGVGVGPCIAMTIEEWFAIRNAVEAALGVAELTPEQRALVGYTTPQEGQ